MVHVMLALAQASIPDVGKSVLKQWFQTVAMHGLSYVSTHPVISGLVLGGLGMTAMFAVRKAVWATVKWTLGIPWVALKQVARPVVAMYRMVRNRTKGTVALRSRLPLLGQVCYVGPCAECGSKYQRRVKATAFHGGQLRGVDVVSGTSVLGCSNCVLS